jgi:hypothetical protein
MGHKETKVAGQWESRRQHSKILFEWNAGEPKSSWYVYPDEDERREDAAEAQAQGGMVGFIPDGLFGS